MFTMDKERGKNLLSGFQPQSASPRELPRVSQHNRHSSPPNQKHVLTILDSSALRPLCPLREGLGGSLREANIVGPVAIGS